MDNMTGAEKAKEKKEKASSGRTATKYDYPLVDGREMTSEEKKIYLEHHPESYHCRGNCYRQRHRYTKLYLTGRYAQDK